MIFEKQHIRVFISDFTSVAPRWVVFCSFFLNIEHKSKPRNNSSAMGWFRICSYRRKHEIFLSVQLTEEILLIFTTLVEQFGLTLVNWPTILNATFATFLSFFRSYFHSSCLPTLKSWIIDSLHLLVLFSCNEIYSWMYQILLFNLFHRIQHCVDLSKPREERMGEALRKCWNMKWIEIVDDDEDSPKPRRKRRRNRVSCDITFNC